MYFLAAHHHQNINLLTKIRACYMLYITIEQNMSDFFAALTQGNVRFPDARIDGDGPLPTTLSGPAGIHGDPDGKYNFNEALLTSIAPYAGPKQNRISSDRNYQQIPHRKQFPVPPIFVPEPGVTAEDSFMMSHPIDMGDLCFTTCATNTAC